MCGEVFRGARCQQHPGDTTVPSMTAHAPRPGLGEVPGVVLLWRWALLNGQGRGCPPRRWDCEVDFLGVSRQLSPLQGGARSTPQAPWV